MLSLSGWLGPTGQVRYVGDGRVACPVQGRDVDVERCLGCVFLCDTVEGAGGTAGIRGIVCRGEPEMAAPLL